MFLHGGGSTLYGDELGLLRLVEGCGGDLFDRGRDGSCGGFLGQTSGSGIRSCVSWCRRSVLGEHLGNVRLGRLFTQSPSRRFRRLLLVEI